MGLVYSEPSRSDDENASWHPDFQQQSTSSEYLLPLETFVPIGRPDITSEDPVASGLVSHELAHELFSAFCQTLAPIYPLVLVPSIWTWQDTRRMRPALFRALLTAASSNCDPELFRMLFRNTGKYLTEEAAINGNKSLDLIQAFLVLSAWYCPMENFQKLKFSQYANLAATLVLDLKSSNDGRYRIPSAGESFGCSEQLTETCRTFLACYFLCSRYVPNLITMRTLSN